MPSDYPVSDGGLPYRAINLWPGHRRCNVGGHDSHSEITSSVDTKLTELQQTLHTNIVHTKYATNTNPGTMHLTRPAGIIHADQYRVVDDIRLFDAVISHRIIVVAVWSSSSSWNVNEGPFRPGYLFLYICI